MKLIHEIETSFRSEMSHDMSRLEYALAGQIEANTTYLNTDRHFVRVIVKGNGSLLKDIVAALDDIGALSFE